MSMGPFFFAHLFLLSFLLCSYAGCAHSNVYTYNILCLPCWSLSTSLSQLLANFIFPRRQFKFYCVHATICHINTYACTHHIDVESSDMPFNEYEAYTNIAYEYVHYHEPVRRRPEHVHVCAFVRLFILIL